jgi:hypothetical protein
MISWYRQIDNANTSREVVAVARDYIASWSPQDLAGLPYAVRPGKMRDAVDIENLHALLVDEYRNTRVSGEELRPLQELTSFFVRASMRIAELNESVGEGDSGSPGKGPMSSAAPEN